MSQPYERDFDTKPYSPDEERVAKWLWERAPDVGTGDDPIGFVLASFGYVMDTRRFCDEELTKKTAAVFPGTIDTSTYSDVEDALDSCDAPCREGGESGRFLNLTERILAMGSGIERLRLRIDLAETYLAGAGRYEHFLKTIKEME